MPDLSSGISFLEQGFEPTDADFKIGGLFFKFGSLTGAVLVSDNINQTEANRETGAIAMVALTGSVIAQFTEGLRLAIAGALVYFPIEGKGGLAGFGQNDLYNLGLSGAPLLRSQLLWNTQIGGWNVVFADDLSIGYASFSNSFGGDFSLFEGFALDEESRAGRYVFRPPNNGNGGDTDFSSGRRNDSSEGTTVVANTVSALTERLILTRARLRLRVYRQDLWYNQGDRGRPILREGASASLASERENLRFKPYISYEASRTDRQNNFDQIIRLGIAGPITDHLYFRGEYGHYWSGFGGDGSLWTATLVHVAGPYTTEEVFYTRTLTSFNEEVADLYGYQISQVLGPKLNATAFVVRSQVEDLRGDNAERTELRAGLRLNLKAGPKTFIVGTGVYGNGKSRNEEIETWTGSLEMNYNFTDTLVGRLFYQYHEFASTVDDASYDENLVVLSVTKFFR